MKKFSCLFLFTVGFIPFATGLIMQNWMDANPDILPPYTAIGLCFLLVWAGSAFLAKRCISDTKTVLIGLHCIPCFVLLLLGVQELLLSRYFPNAIGVWTQCFYLPLLSIGSRLTPMFHTFFAVHCVCFLLMLGSAWIGCSLKKPR